MYAVGFRSLLLYVKAFHGGLGDLTFVWQGRARVIAWQWKLYKWQVCSKDSLFGWQEWKHGNFLFSLSSIV